MRVLLDVRPTYQWVLAIATGLLLLTGCGDKVADNPASGAQQRLAVEAPWRDGGRIPRRYTCDGADMTPIVGTLTRVGGVRRYGFVMVDRDAPGGSFVHWARAGTTEARNSFGRIGYGGPCPPRGGGPHHYVLTVYGLSHPPDFPRGADPHAAVSAIEAASIARGSITGVYSR